MACLPKELVDEVLVGFTEPLDFDVLLSLDEEEVGSDLDCLRFLPQIFPKIKLLPYISANPKNAVHLIPEINLGEALCLEPRQLFLVNLEEGGEGQERELKVVAHFQGNLISSEEVSQALIRDSGLVDFKRQRICLRFEQELRCGLEHQVLKHRSAEELSVFLVVGTGGYKENGMEQAILEFGIGAGMPGLGKGQVHLLHNCLKPIIRFIFYLLLQADREAPDILKTLPNELLKVTVNRV